MEILSDTTFRGQVSVVGDLITNSLITNRIDASSFTTEFELKVNGGSYRFPLISDRDTRTIATNRDTVKTYTRLIDFSVAEACTSFYLPIHTSLDDLSGKPRCVQDIFSIQSFIYNPDGAGDGYATLKPVFMDIEVEDYAIVPNQSSGLRYIISKSQGITIPSNTYLIKTLYY